MNHSSICKFNFNASNDLVCSCFVLERTDAQREQRVSHSYGIYLVLKGSGVVVVEGRHYAVSQGCLFFICKGENFSIEKMDMEYAYVCFHGRRSREYIDRLGIHGENRIFSGYESLISFWMDCLLQVIPGNADLLSEAVLLYSLAQLKPPVREENDVISEILRLTGEQFTDPALSLASVSGQIGYHEKYISTLFKKQRGVAYTQYLRQLRIKHAVFLMDQGVVSVKNVALLSGFRDALYFSKVFKAVEGITPTEYLQNLEAAKTEQ